MADLVTLANVKSYLQLTTINWDTILPAVISAVSEQVKREVGCDIAQAEYADVKVNGSGKDGLDLPNWPITEVSEVTDEDGYAYLEGYDEDFMIETFCLRRMNGVWPKGHSNFIVSYKAGYATIPADIVLVCYELIARKWKTMKGSEWGESSRSFPDGSVTSVNTDGELTKTHREILAKYKRPKL